MSPHPLLEVRDLSIHVGNHRILEPLSFTIAPGSVLALVGESGSGKTLTALALAGLETAPIEVSGEVHFEGRPINRSNPAALRELRRHGIRYVFQEPYASFNPALTIRAHLEESIPSRLPRQERRERTASLLRAVGLQEVDQVLRSWPFQLSGGMLQRVSIACALAGEPRLLVCDEPTTALDTVLQGEILALLASIAHDRGTALLFITHNLRLLDGFADEVLVLRQGRRIESGRCDAVLRNPRDPYTRALLACIPSIDEAPDRLPVLAAPSQ